ncbi:MAG: abortive infection family protein [Planctomycetota bacterium]
MKVSPRTVSAIGRIVTGDEKISPYRSGPQLVRLFNEYGANDTYGQGFPSRWQYAENRLRELNGSAVLSALVCEVLDPRGFMDSQFDWSEAAEYLNNRLRYDGFEVVKEKGLAQIRDLAGSLVACDHPFEGSTDEGHLFIDEQIAKSQKRIEEGDFDGAITNARSLLEAVLREIERHDETSPSKYDGDLIKLYRRIQKKLNLEPGQTDLDSSLKQVLTGMNSVVNGIAALSNRLGDRHVRIYRPAKHHAILVVNAAKTLVSFLFETQRYQAEKDEETQER